MKIYCGYQGCGKSTYCKTHPDTSIDFDSSAFVKSENWEVDYVDRAISLSALEHKDVFISAHQCVINELLRRNIKFFEVLVPAYDKKAWKNRLEFRYNTNPTQGNYNALIDFQRNFDRDMEYYNSLPAHIIVHRVSAKVVTNIADLI